MKLLISGICGFVGRTIAEGLLDCQAGADIEIIGIDNLSRSGSSLNRDLLLYRGVRVVHGDIRLASDIESIGRVDWIIDAAANPSVMAGVDGKTSSRQLVQHNLLGTINLLEHCKLCSAGFTLISTSRVYGIKALASVEVEVGINCFEPVKEQNFPAGISIEGIAENFSTESPISLYGATKLASETLALEYGGVFNFPVWINRCGVLAGAGQFGRIDQGIFSYWIHSWRAQKPLVYIGFQGSGHQVRDCFHPIDLVPLLQQQILDCHTEKLQIVNLGGGKENSMSLKMLSVWCEDRFGPNLVGIESTPRPFDLPWVVMDSSRAKQTWDWHLKVNIESILNEIAEHAEANPNWLELSNG